jgi:nondiscriminating glutamyl-tRNA synthetase
MNREIRVRYAPSPTGYLHIGNARTALFNYLFAKHNNGKFILRIEDTDLERNIKNGVESQISNLNWLGIDYDEGPNKNQVNNISYFQSERIEIYQEYINKLLTKKIAYKCYCTSERLDKLSQSQKDNGQIPRYDKCCLNLTQSEIIEKEKNNIPYRVRFKVPQNKIFQWNDLVKGNIEFNSDDVSGDFVILKENGIPTYNFAVVIDDHLMEISHVLRGEDHIANTPKQLMIYEALEFEKPIFGHMSLIVNENKKKLSKRDGGIIQFIEQYKELGYLPEAIFNFISLLGWSPKGTQELFTVEELIEIFDQKRLSKSPATFDVNKLTWINNQYFKKITNEKANQVCMPFLMKEYGNNINTQYCERVIGLYKNQISYGAEIVEASKVFFQEQEITEEAEKFMDENNGYQVYETFMNKLDTQFINAENIKKAIEETKVELDVKGKGLFMPIRIGVAKQMHGPELIPTIELLLNEK